MKPGYFFRFEPVKSNLTKIGNLQGEPGKMFRLTESEKNIRFDPNLDIKLNFF